MERRFESFEASVGFDQKEKKRKEWNAPLLTKSHRLS
jgi:hypothetical protein